MNDNKNDVLMAAVQMAADGIAVFPCKSEVYGKEHKAPHTPKGFKDASTDMDQVDTWWMNHPDAIIGVPTGSRNGLVVLDVDIKKGKKGDVRLKALEAEYGKLPDTRTVRTHSGGFHYIFEYPTLKDGETIQGSADKLGRGLFDTDNDKTKTGLDIRGEGGYVIAPPSPGYTIINDAPIAPMPECLVELTIKRPHAKTAAVIPSTGYTGSDRQRYESALMHLTSSIGNDDWIKLTMAAKAAGIAFDVWHSWCQSGDGYVSEADCKKRWDSIDPDGAVTAATLIHEATAAGWIDPRKHLALDGLDWLNTGKSKKADKPKAAQPESEPSDEPDDIDEAEFGRRINELAKLSLQNYERARTDAIKRLGLRATVLDKLVKEARASLSINEADEKAGLLTEVEPWTEPVVLDELLTEMNTRVTDYLILAPHSDTALTLWSAFTWVFEKFHTCPLLLITSPEKRCGKTRALEVLTKLTHKPVTAVSITPAVLFRMVDAYQPTLMLDEADQFLAEAPDLTALINGGFNRAAAYSWRCSGDDNELKRFGVFCPKAISMIKVPQETVVDRAIVVQMARKRTNQKVKALKAETEFPELLRKFARFALDHADDLKSIEPELPQGLDDRSCDKWKPLLAIAEFAGGAWPELARNAAISLSEVDADESAGIELLRDCRKVIPDIFDSKDGYVTTKSLIEALVAIEGGRWSHYRNYSPLTDRQAARLFKPFGIKPDKVGDRNNRRRGYTTSEFEPIWEQYL